MAASDAGMRRVLVSGISGAGKTTLARALGRALELPHHELDALHHGAGWVKRPSFEEEVACFAATDRWVTEDQYGAFIGELLWRRAETLVWLDFERAVVMRRVLRRSFARALLRRELWNGNREQWWRWVDRGHPIRWAWSQHAHRRACTADLVSQYPHLRVVHLRSPHAADQWLAAIRAEAGLSR